MVHHPATAERARRFVRALPLLQLLHLLPRANNAPGLLALPQSGGVEEGDPVAQMAQADAADASLMRLVLCAASATLVLALATSLL